MSRQQFLNTYTAILAMAGMVLILLNVAETEKYGTSHQYYISFVFIFLMIAVRLMVQATNFNR